MRHFANVALKKKETIKNQCFANEVKTNTVIEAKTIKAKQYEDIPGPNGIFGIGTFYHYFPVFGMQINFAF